jgi:uncharacterized protein YbaP (TraB family)
MIRPIREPHAVDCRRPPFEVRMMFRLRTFLCAWAAALMALVLPAYADPAPVQCHGADMMAELEARSPSVFATVMSESHETANTEAVLWKVEKPGLQPSYLLGTMHLSDPRISQLSPRVKDIIAHSKSVALEVADLSDRAVGIAMANAGRLLIYTNGKTLSTELSEDEFKKVQRVVQQAGMPEAASGVLKPWLISMLLSTSDCERRQVAAGAKVLDLQVAQEAQRNGLAVHGLETIEQQLESLASIPEDQQIAMLKVGLKYADRGDDLMETITQMYLKRQIGAAMPFQLALAAEMGVPASAFDGFKKALLADRNVRMRDAAEPLLQNGSAFIAVGALHLVGSSGLVALLRERGYTVAAVE